MASKGTVLIIDDDAVFRRTFRDRIIADGFEVVEATDGEDGMNKLRANRIDAVICDMFMPRKSGSQVLAEIFADDALKSTPVIILSALGEPSDIQRALKAGATDYLVKGMFGPNDVLSKLTRIMQERKAEFAAKYKVAIQPVKYDGVQLAKDLDFGELYVCKICNEEKKLELVQKSGEPGAFDARFTCACDNKKKAPSDV